MVRNAHIHIGHGTQIDIVVDETLSHIGRSTADRLRRYHVCRYKMVDVVQEPCHTYPTRQTCVTCARRPASHRYQPAKHYLDLADHMILVYYS